MADLLLYGSGWTQRWTLGPDQEAEVRTQILKVGTNATGSVTVTDPNTDAAVTMAVNWSMVAVALVLPDHPGAESETAGRYA